MPKNPPKNPEEQNPQEQNSVISNNWILSGLIEGYDEKPSTTPDIRGFARQTQTTVAKMRALVKKWNNENDGSNSR